MAEADKIRVIQLWQQDCEEVEVSEIVGGEEIADHKVDIEKHEFMGDEEEVKRYDRENLRHDSGDESES